MRKTQIDDLQTDSRTCSQTDRLTVSQSDSQTERQIEKLRCAHISKEITKKRMREMHVPSTQRGRERWIKKGRGS